MKTCTRCKVPKELTQFNKHNTSPDGLSYYCKDCIKITCQKSRQKKLEHYRAMNLAWNNKNKPKTREITKRWRERNPERVLATQRKWREGREQRKRQDSLFEEAITAWAS